MLMPLAAYSDDAADVNAALGQLNELGNAGDAIGFGTVLTESFIGYAGAFPFVIDGRDAFVEGIRQGVESNESSQWVISEDRQVRINGRTAVVAYTAGLRFKPIDGPWQSTFINAVTTWVKSGRDWKLAAYMNRPIPHGSVP
jgi:ketosteroid isomerase-like protein